MHKDDAMEGSPLSHQRGKEYGTVHLQRPSRSHEISRGAAVYSVLTVCLASVLVGTTLAYSSPAVLELKQLQDPELKFSTHLSGIFGVSWWAFTKEIDTDTHQHHFDTKGGCRK